MTLELRDIRLRHFHKRHEDGKDTDLLDGIDMTVLDGKVTALIGGNGVGKTTLFNIISGFERNFTGKVFFDGNDITKLSPYRIAQWGIGRLFQGTHLMNDLTLLENMKIAFDEPAWEHPLASFRPRKVAEREAVMKKMAIRALETMFGEGNPYLMVLDKKASDLSYGQQRLLAMARLLMGNSKLWLLDEPTSGVNPKHFETFRQIIRNMVESKGKTVLLIEHNMDFVRNVADHCMYLADGHIIKSGSPQEILDDPEIRKDYMGL